ncbi:MAG: hypothetical protein LBH06_06025 [Rikenellaceae bacterium]|jgi:hypothetical protein|nr:hypothetical protein [Rikenellaceae bacterium]
MNIVFTEKECETLKNLIAELDSFYYDDEEEVDGGNKTWRFDDVDAQREIACELANILRTKF